MLFGVVCQSVIALRSEPFEYSEMISQVLFGETFSILEEHKDWLRIVLTHDLYEGWIDRKSTIIIDEEQHHLLLIDGIGSIATRLFSARANSSEFPIRLCPGSTLYNYDQSSGIFSLPCQTYQTAVVPFDCIEEEKQLVIVELAKQFINAPYLWGGRTPYGIDCSGFTQVVYKMAGIPIPRDSRQQVHIGSPVEFVNDYQPGDLAFFDDEEGNVVHVGIVLTDNQIIHSSGFVRIDKLDQQGIFSVLDKKYTHKLRVVKRIVENSHKNIHP